MVDGLLVKLTVAFLWLQTSAKSSLALQRLGTRKHELYFPSEASLICQFSVSEVSRSKTTALTFLSPEGPTLGLAVAKPKGKQRGKLSLHSVYQIWFSMFSVKIAAIQRLGVMWNVRLFPEPVGANINTSRPLKFSVDSLEFLKTKLSQTGVYCLARAHFPQTPSPREQSIYFTGSSHSKNDIRI